MTYATLKDLPKGEFFKRKESAATVYIKGDYDRASKRQSCVDTNDTSREIFLKTSAPVFTNFEF